MLSQALIDQVRGHFAGLGSRYVFLIQPSTHPKQAELRSLLDSFASASDHISIQEGTKTSATVHAELLKDGEPTGIVFNGVPGGHEFTSLVLAVLNADGKGRLPDLGLQARVKALKGPLSLQTYISLTCTNCPDVVQSLNQMALLHPEFVHHMVDGALVPQELEGLGIQGVPAVVAGGKIIHVGKASFGELLENLENHFGIQEAATGAADKSSATRTFDQIVVGGGPAGVSAAIYSARKGLKVALVAQRIGGQVNDTQAIENLISVPGTTGPRLSGDLRKHLAAYGIEVMEHRRVTEIRTHDQHRRKEVHIQGGETLEAPQVIVATGASWRELGVPGEKEHIGRGVAFCPHCDGPFFAGKAVAVVGGGNSGIEAAIDLAGIARSVQVLEFAEELRADQVLVDKARSLANVSIQTRARTTEVLGNGSAVHGLAWEDRASGEIRQEKLDGVFVQIGLVPNAAFLGGLLETTRSGEIVIDGHGRTSVPGIYAAGDVSTVPYKQIVIALGEGAKAALAAFEDRMRGV